jgi:hypothetical protein
MGVGGRYDLLISHFEEEIRKNHLSLHPDVQEKLEQTRIDNEVTLTLVHGSCFCRAYQQWE